MRYSLLIVAVSRGRDIHRTALAALHAELASLLVGIDGRRVRKTVLSALASRTEVAMEPGLVTAVTCAAPLSSLATRERSSKQPFAELTLHGRPRERDCREVVNSALPFKGDRVSSTK